MSDLREQLRQSGQVLHQAQDAISAAVRLAEVAQAHVENPSGTSAQWLARDAAAFLAKHRDGGDA